MKIWYLTTALVFVLGCSSVRQSAADRKAFTVNTLFSDSMVLQEGETIKVWGTARDKSKVEVTLNGTGKGALTKGGKWMVSLPAMKHGGPYDLSIRCGNETKTLTNVLIGDVWLASGQSNMQWSVKGSNNAKEEIANAKYPRLRIFSVKSKCAYSPLSEVEGTWHVVTPETIANFSAVGYYFGRHIHSKTGRNIGIIASSRGGSTAEAWVPEQTILAQREPFYKGYLDHRDKMRPVFAEPDWKEKNAAQTNAWKEAANHIYEKDNGTSLGYQAADLDDSSWPQTNVPNASGTECFEEVDGGAWFRKTVDVPPAWKGQELELHLGRLSMFDIAYVNGKKVGSTFWGKGKPWHKKRVYPVSADLVKNGKTSIAVFILNREGIGGFMGEPSDMFLGLKGEGKKTVSLAGSWRYRIHGRLDGKKYPVRPPRLRQHKCATLLYNSMIHPLIQFPIKGAVWYQGESNADKPNEYRQLFPLLIRTWRELWKSEFPFYFVQLANYRTQQSKPFEGNWAEVRDAQRLTLALPHTGMAVALDVGSATTIHPRNKQDVGKRLGLIALAKDYGSDVVYSGPLYKSMEKKGATLVLSFTHTGSGLCAPKGQDLRGFAIAGSDKNYRWAKAKIVDNRVVLSHPEIKDPKYAAYAWANNPIGNLCNREGLPASSFKTSDP